MNPMSSTTASRALMTAVLAAAVGVAGAGCDGAPGGAAPSSTGPISSPAATPLGTGRSDTASSRDTGPAPSSTPGEENQMKIDITIGEQHFQATVTESAAARDLAAQLPVTIDMIDHGAVEKTGPLPSPLSLEGQPDGADPDVGDVGYYAPGNALVLYYGDQSFFPGIVILGRLDGDAAQRISELEGPVTATITVQDD
jgi:hypothetical protein